MSNTDTFGKDAHFGINASTSPSNFPFSITTLDAFSSVNSIWNLTSVQFVFKSTARVHSHLGAHVILRGRIVISSKLHVPQVRNPNKEHHEVLMSGSMDEELPQCVTLLKQPSCRERETPLVNFPVLGRPIIELIKTQILDPIQEKPFPEAKIHVP